MAKAKASGFKGYTPEEVEEEGKKDLLVLKEMLGEQQVSLKSIVELRQNVPVRIYVWTRSSYYQFQF